MFRKKIFIVSISFVLGMFGLSYVFGYSSELKFDVSHTNLHLNCPAEYPVINVTVSGDLYNGYTAYIPWVGTLNYINVVDTNISSDFTTKSAVASLGGDCPGVNCMKFLGSKSPSPMLNGLRVGGTFTLQNNGYFRNQTIFITGGYNDGTDHALSKVVSGTDTYSIFNGGLTLFALNVSGTLGPCTLIDSVAPTFGFTGGMVPHVTNYTLPQFNDRIYIFDLVDPGSPDRGFSAGGFPDDWSPDWTGGTNYDQTVKNGSGIDLSTFVFEVAVETDPDSSTFDKVILTGTLNIIGSGTITGSVAGLEFHPYDFTWNRWNRNYTGSALTGILSDNDTYSSFYGGHMFGDLPEEEVIMTGYIYDRATAANKSTTTFTSIHFNYGAIPWSSNQSGSSLITGCGTEGSPYISITAPVTDSGAYITRSNDGFVLEPFKVYLHDDWAGIDTGTIEVYLSGMQGNGIWTGITLTVGNGITITPFAWTNAINTLTDRGEYENVSSVIGSTRNYETLIDYNGVRDPETKIEVSIDYKDLVARTGTQVTCSYENSYAPYVNNWTTDVQLNRYPYASGAELSGFVIKVEDERAGVNSGTIVLTISGRQVNDVALRTTSPIVLSFSGFTLNPWLNEYTTHSSIIDGGQNYNYTITVPYNADWAGYFAPEHPVDIIISYTDFADNVQTSNKQYADLDAGTGNYGTLYDSTVHTVGSTNTNYLLIDILANPFLTTFGFTTQSYEINTTPEWFDAFPIRTFANGYTGGLTEFSGMQFGIFDYWAGVDSGYNYVKIVGTRRGVPATYLFAAEGSTGLNWTEWTDCGTTDINCVTGTMTKVAVKQTGTDIYNGQHPTLETSTGYTFQISSGHGIYFDYGIYGDLSTYKVDVYMSDMRPDDPNDLIDSGSIEMDTLACLFLERCSHDMLTFVWGESIDTLPGQTVTQNPLTGAIDNPFAGSRVNIVGSGVSIDTGNHIIYCANSEGLIDAPVVLDFTNAPNLTGNSTGSYQAPTLKVADGLFELSGDVLIVR